MGPKQPLGPPELPGAHTPVEPAKSEHAVAPKKAEKIVPVVEAEEAVEPVQTHTEQPVEQSAEPEPDSEPKPAKFTPLTSVQPRMGAADKDDDPDPLNEHVADPGDPDGVVAAEEREIWKARQPDPKEPLFTQPKRKHRLLTAFIVLVVIAAGAYGAYWYGSKQADKDKPKPATTTHQTTNAPHQNTTQQPTNVPTKHYDSTTYTLGFDYPETWKVTDTAPKLTVVSPAVSLTNVDGSTVNGHVVVTFQNKQTTIAGYPANGAVAVLESQKLTYKQPTPVQRAQTYLSLLQYTKPNGLDALYVTGDYGYQQSQQIPMSDVVQGNPLVSITFQSCTSDDCGTGTPTMLTLLASKWNSTQASKQIVDLLQSITLD